MGSIMRGGGCGSGSSSLSGRVLLRCGAVGHPVEVLLLLLLLLLGMMLGGRLLLLLLLLLLVLHPGRIGGIELVVSVDMGGGHHVAELLCAGCATSGRWKRAVRKTVFLKNHKILESIRVLPLPDNTFRCHCGRVSISVRRASRVIEDVQGSNQAWSRKSDLASSAVSEMRVQTT